MQPIRVLLSGMPRMLSDIVMAVIRTEADIEIAGVSEGARALLGDAAAARADVVVLMGATTRPEACQALLQAAPARKVLEITDGDLCGVLHELRPARVPLGELSPSTLLAAIRSARPPASRPIH